MTRWARAALAGLLLAACDDSDVVAPLLNRCVQSLECGTGASCDAELGICVRQTATEPYRYALQVLSEDVGDAGVLAPLTTVPASFTQTVNLGWLGMRRAVRVTGTVRGSDGKSLPAEVVFTPRMSSALGRGEDVFTRSVNGSQVYTAQLAPDTTYDVVVYPLGTEASRSYPPRTFERTTNSDASFDFSYPALTRLSGRFLDEDGMPARSGLKVRVRARDSQLALSSIGDVAENGAFSVFTVPEVMQAQSGYELALDLSEIVGSQRVEVAFDLALAQGANDVTWTMPKLPEVVQFIGSVEVSALSNAPSRASDIAAKLTWISSFEDPGGQNDVRALDWCTLKRPGAPKGTFRCSARIETAVGVERQVSLRLLPGDYEVFVTPLGGEDDPQRVASERFVEQILSQPSGVQSGQAFRLSAANLYNGRVRSPSGKAMPAVSISATALGVLAGLPEVARYNRSDRQSSRSDGRFRLAVDLGMYDLLAQPPEGSGYAWVLVQNRRITGGGGPPFELQPQLPVMLRGQVVDAQGTAIGGARVDGYALVEDPNGDDERPIRVARTVSDTRGYFALQMPPCIGDRCANGGDAGVSDASTDAN